MTKAKMREQFLDYAKMEPGPHEPLRLHPRTPGRPGGMKEDSPMDPKAIENATTAAYETALTVLDINSTPGSSGRPRHGGIGSP